MALLRTYSPYIMFPIAVTVGTIGYMIESKLRSDEVAPDVPSVLEKRDQRQLTEAEGKDLRNVDKLTNRSFIPKTIFEKKQWWQMVRCKYLIGLFYKLIYLCDLVLSSEFLTSEIVHDIDRFVYYF